MRHACVARSDSCGRGSIPHAPPLRAGHPCRHDRQFLRAPECPRSRARPCRRGSHSRSVSSAYGQRCITAEDCSITYSCACSFQSVLLCFDIQSPDVGAGLSSRAPADCAEFLLLGAKHIRARSAVSHARSSNGVLGGRGAARKAETHTRTNFKQGLMQASTAVLQPLQQGP